MRRVRYSQWKDSSPRAPGADRIFDQLNEYLDETGDLQQAMRRLLQRGLKEEGERIPGLDDLISQVTREMKRLYGQYRIQTAADQMRQKLDSVVDRERQFLQNLRDTKPEAQEKEEFLDRLPNECSRAIEKLASYDFEDPEAAKEYQDLLAQLEQLRRLENYLRREGSFFHGQTPVDLKKSQDLMDRMEGLRRLESQLSSSHLSDVDLELLEKLLGGDMQRDFEGVVQMEALLKEAGYVVDRGDHFQLTPRGVRRIGQVALRDIYRRLLKEGLGQHPIFQRGSQETSSEESRPYVQGDPFRVDMVRTLKNALLRHPELPLRLHPKDFSIYEEDYSTQAATVLLLDMSWSMSWDGRFAAAKKVALAMESLIRSQYPRDYFAIVGFFTRAVELKPEDLPEATWNMGDPFTNLQDGLHLACELLERKPNRNQQMIIITDGQPTAYYRQGRLYCEWPLSFGGISQRAAEETLKEAERVTRRGIRINTFMLDDSPVLKSFIDEMTRINRGRAFYASPDRLGEYLLIDYVSRRRKRV